MTNCVNCGSNQLVLVERLGALETWRCESCGREVTRHVYHPSLEPQLPENLEPVFNAIAHWRSKPTKEQMHELRSLFPKLKAMSDAELLRKAYDRTSFDLGRFNNTEMQEKEPHLEGLDVEINRIPVM